MRAQAPWSQRDGAARGAASASFPPWELERRMPEARRLRRRRGAGIDVPEHRRVGLRTRSEREPSKPQDEHERARRQKQLDVAGHRADRGAAVAQPADDARCRCLGRLGRAAAPRPARGACRSGTPPPAAAHAARRRGRSRCGESSRPRPPNRSPSRPRARGEPAHAGPAAGDPGAECGAWARRPSRTSATASPRSTPASCGRSSTRATSSWSGAARRSWTWARPSRCPACWPRSRPWACGPRPWTT